MRDKFTAVHVTRLAGVAACLLVTGLAGGARAQQVEVPVLVMESPETEAGEVDTELNLANLVQTAAKGVTTVQEAPAIITIIPADEIVDRGSRNLEDVIDRVPGWIRIGGEFNEFPSLNPLGEFQATLLLRDGVSMFDSMVNIATVSRVQPLETIKRIEVVTGPGGVLWGANSFLGVINVITKDAEDVNGVEASVGAGSGPGDQDVLRGYVMAGAPKLFGGRAKLFIHGSFESYQGAIYDIPNHLFGSPTPNPNGLSLYGPITQSDPAQSMIFNFDGKLSSGPFSLYWSFPFTHRYFSMGFPGGVLRQNLAEDNQRDPVTGALLCPQVGIRDPSAGDTNDNCYDKAHAYRKEEIDFYERYGIVEYKERFSNKAGITAKAYFIQFVRQFDPLTILSPIPQLLEGGLEFNADLTNYRAGGSIDGDVQISDTVRLIYGAEAFHEWLPDSTIDSRQGAGVEASFLGPYNLNVLPLNCPRTASWDGTQPVNIQFVPGCPVTFAFAADRTVMGAFAALQWRATPRLIFDAGIRGEVAPAALGSRSYSPQPLGEAAVVYEFIPDWHVKANFTQGFRPPVFNNTDSNPQAVEFGGSPDLKVETSTAFQSEVNARLLKGRRKIRELDLRADLSYTRLDNLIITQNGQYVNGAPRGITSAEVSAKLYLKGDHRLELGYTWLKTDSADKGAFRTYPEHWFNVGGVVSLIPHTLELNGTIRVWGAFEDPNLRVDARDLHYDINTGSAFLSMPDEIDTVNPTENVLDRIPPAAELQLGIRYRTMKDHLQIAATGANLLNARHYQPDPFSDFEPRTEYLPNPYEDWRIFTSVTYSY